MPQALKVPPHSDEAEMSVLGAILIDKNAIVEIVAFLRPSHFYKDNHGKIFDCILELYEEREPVDLVTLSEKLKKKGFYKEVGGSTYLTELVNSVPTSANVEHYAKIVKDHFTKRELITSASKISEMAFSADADIKEILDKTEQSVFHISQENLAGNFIPIKEALAESFDRLDELQKRGEGLRGIPTGFSELDKRLAGMQDSNLLILAARPGLGKTAMALGIGMHASVVKKIPVGMFSLEMSKEELVDRLLVAQADIDAWRLKTGKLTDEDFDKLQEAMGELADAPLYIDDTPGISIMEMRTKARRLQMEHGLKLIIVDYLQLINPGKSFENRVQEVSYVSQSLKNLARELKIPVLALSQLSRAVEARGTKVPQLADLRESGSIEQDSDVVMFLYRPDDDVSSDKILVELLISKHRNGPLGKVSFLFKGDRIRFYQAETKREE